MKRTNPITELYAWVTIQPSGYEMIAVPSVFGNTYPLVSSSKELAELRMHGLAKIVERETGHPTKLVKFIRAEVLI